MTVPCTCKIPDPVVVNGQCLVCYGDRPALRERTRTDQGDRPSTFPGALTEHRSSAEPDGGPVPEWRSKSGSAVVEPVRDEGRSVLDGALSADPDDSSERRCSRCKTTKPAREFSRNKANKDGLNAICKPCDVEKNRAYRKNNPRWSETQQRRRKLNREVISERDRAYRARFPFKRLVDHVRAHGKSYGARGVASAAAIKARVAFYGYRCYLCGDPWNEIDHVIPLSRGGSNWPANLRPVCGPCNRRKWAKSLAEMRCSS